MPHSYKVHVFKERLFNRPRKPAEVIWHCPCQPDRNLAEILVKQQMPWKELAEHYGKPYPYTLADKYDLVYRLLGCKKD